MKSKKVILKHVLNFFFFKSLENVRGGDSFDDMDCYLTMQHGQFPDQGNSLTFTYFIRYGRRKTKKQPPT